MAQKEWRSTNLRDMVITTGTPTDKFDTEVVSGQASNSLVGKNELTQYDTAGGISKMGPFGGMPSGK